MNDKEQEVIASFMAVDEKRNAMWIIVGQETITHPSGETTYSKNLYLNEINGQKIYTTEDPDIFKLPNGTTLKKKERL